ncbi:MAG: hypothetical protein HRT87_04635 [Legionellales bacterium]|nr:hypothetical protein [Legionellales bacterium]
MGNYKIIEFLTDDIKINELIKIAIAENKELRSKSNISKELMLRKSQINRKNLLRKIKMILPDDESGRYENIKKLYL